MSGVRDTAVRHPKIYAWTDDDHAAVPWQGSREGTGLIKVGYTDRDVHERIRESRGVKSPIQQPYDLLLVEAAVTDNGAVFRDHSVHAQLERAGVRRAVDGDGNQTEWFEVTADELRSALAAVRSGESAERLTDKRSFRMRAEQAAAVKATADYFRAHTDDERPPHFLWNAKMRFGKTFTAYQLAKEMGWTRVLVLTYKPAVENGWREDLEDHGDFTGWRFKGKSDPPADLDDPTPIAWFVSFQDVLGTDDDGNPKVKNEDLFLATWDVVVIDEYHFGAWRDAARSLYAPALGGDPTERREHKTPDVEDDVSASDFEQALVTLDVRHYLYLSGTPFRALTHGEFLEDQVFNWTYADEQRAKVGWNGKEPNPYAALPTMHLFAYEMPEALRQVALNNASQFSLTEFFKTVDDGGTPRFVHEHEVQKWLDLLRGQDITQLWSNVSNLATPPLPYEDTSLLRALQHTVWYLPGVGACEAMRNLLAAPHNTFYRDYQVVLAAGPGAGVGANALPPVEQAISAVPQETKSITPTCAKLLTGVTVPAWAGIFMLQELQSPETYFQAAFRVQSPWTSKVADPIEGGEEEVIHKHDCFVIDFSPNRALQLIVDYATELRGEIASERDQEQAVEEFLEFLPVLVFEGYGMSQLQAADVIDFLTRGVSASMLARRWNSSELITLDVRAMETLLNDPELVESLEQIEMFRDLKEDLTAMISTHKELRKKKVAGKLSSEDKKRDKDATTRRETLRRRLQHFVARVPAFMYLTDDRERTIKDIISQDETEMFEQVTSLTLEHFQQLVDAGVFDDSKMDDAVWKFRQFEEPSLGYTEVEGDGEQLRGGWTLVRDERFAHLIDEGLLHPTDLLSGPDGAEAVVTDDYGIAVAGVRYATPSEAAVAAGADDDIDGWAYWKTSTENGGEPLTTLRELVDV